MRRTLALAVAALEVFAPERIVAWGERLAFENPGTGRLRPWTLPMARLEGLVFGWLLLTGRVRSPALAKGLGVVGLPALVLPRTVLERALTIAYENPDEIEVKAWVVPLTRLLGAVYLTVALFSRRATGSDGESATD